MGKYQSFEDIDKGLKQLSLERDIALEELKIVKNNFGNSLKPAGLLGYAFKILRKYGTLMLVKKIFK